MEPYVVNVIFASYMSTLPQSCLLHD